MPSLEISGIEFDKTINSGIVLIDFYADWCMPCLMMASVIEELAEKFKGKIRVAKINVDEAQEISQRFKVLSIPTLIIFKKGKEVERIIGTQQTDAIEGKLRRHL